jgi:hypothetical protein
MSNPNFRRGSFLGAAAAVNIPLGFIPDRVELINVTDGDSINTWYRGRVMAFTSGGTYALKAGDRIQGATNKNVRTTVRQVHVTSGSFAAGTAAGFIVFDVLDETGTFGAENVDLLDPSGGNAVLTLDVATVAAQAEAANVVTILAVAAAPAAILPYVGSAGTASHGFTVAAGTAEANKLFVWGAWREGPEYG